MFSFINKNFLRITGFALAFTAMQACNKEFEDIKGDNAAPPSTKPTAGALIETDANYSILKAAVSKAGLLDALKVEGGSYTVFAPDNAAFTASGLSEAAINALPAAQVQAILSYHVIPNAFTSAQITTNFPNVQMPTLLPLPVGNPLVKMSIFPSRRGNTVWANNIPVTQPDIEIANGVMHKVAAVVAPPQMLIKQILAADPQMSFLLAAIERADVGQTGLNRLDSAINFGLANLTVFAPTNDAFRPVLAALLPAGTPISEAVFAFLPVETVRGIVAYHILGQRAYSVNMPSVATNIPTLLNGAVPTHPGVNVLATFTGPVVTDLKVTGVGNRGVSATVTTKDINAVNGVVHKINMVLMPQ